MPLLAIETTCDETAAAVVTRSREVLASVVASQEQLHARWRGVVPEIASRAHVERIIPVIDEAVRRSGMARSELEAVAVAVRPGLVGSLLVGLAAAKAIAAASRVPIVGYDHIAAHLYACRLAHGESLPYPFVGLVASGGHTSLFHVRSPLDLERLGGTIDDAAGEAFDKAASLLADTPPPVGRARADLAASFQQAVVDCIVVKLELAIDRTGCRAIGIGGGVASNTSLREAVEALGRRRGLSVFVPPPSLCTDNAAMGAIAWERLERGDDDGLLLDVMPGTDRSRRSR
jgi:N6-L-threonylcarbamoyladenine synthase